MINAVVSFLRPYVSQLELLYKAPINEGAFRTYFGNSVIIEGDNSYHKNLWLKKFLIMKFRSANDSEKQQLSEYYIGKWGGIRRYTKHKENIERFREIEGCETIPKEAKAFPFEQVSSWSKYLSLACPNWAIIYDSKTTFSLNTLNFVYGCNYNIFPIPTSQVRKIELFDINTLLIAQKLKEQKGTDPLDVEKKCFFARNQAYTEYCKIMSSIHAHLFKEGEPIYKTEMLIFSLADSVIYEALIEFVKN